MSLRTSMTEALEAIRDETDGEQITVADLTAALRRRGFGALLVGPALITILPTGAIPGVPALCGVFIFVVSVQIVFGRSHPWLPKRLKTISFSRSKYSAGVQRVRPYTVWIDQFFHPRFEFLTTRPAQRVIAVVCVFLSVAMIVLGFIPFAPAILGVSILFFGLGLSVRDGLLAAIGFLLVGAAIVGLPFLF